MERAVLKAEPEHLIKLCDEVNKKIYYLKEASEELSGVLTQLNEVVDSPHLQIATKALLESISATDNNINHAQMLVHDIVRSMEEIILAQSSCGSFSLGM